MKLPRVMLPIFLTGNVLSTCQGDSCDHLSTHRKETELYNAEEMWKRALVYWSRAAAQGYSAARVGPNLYTPCHRVCHPGLSIVFVQVRLGDYFYYGWGTGIDYEQAASHYRQEVPLRVQ